MSISKFHGKMNDISPTKVTTMKIVHAALKEKDCGKTLEVPQIWSNNDMVLQASEFKLARKMSAGLKPVPGKYIKQSKPPEKFADACYSDCSERVTWNSDTVHSCLADCLPNKHLAMESLFLSEPVKTEEVKNCLRNEKPVEPGASSLSEGEICRLQIQDVSIDAQSIQVLSELKVKQAIEIEVPNICSSKANSLILHVASNDDRISSEGLAPGLIFCDAVIKCLLDNMVDKVCCSLAAFCDDSILVNSLGKERESTPKNFEALNVSVSVSESSKQDVTLNEHVDLDGIENSKHSCERDTVLAADFSKDMTMCAPDQSQELGCRNECLIGGHGTRNTHAIDTRLDEIEKVGVEADTFYPRTLGANFVKRKRGRPPKVLLNQHFSDVAGPGISSDEESLCSDMSASYEIAAFRSSDANLPAAKEPQKVDCRTGEILEVGDHKTSECRIHDEDLFTGRISQLPNFAVVFSFCETFGSLLDLPYVSLDVLEQSIASSDGLAKKGDLGLLDELHMKLLRRLGKSPRFSCLASCGPDRLLKLLFKLASMLELDFSQKLCISGYDSLGAEERLVLLKELCDLQFDENLRFHHGIFDRYLKNDREGSLRLQPIGSDMKGHSVWLQEDKHCCLRVYGGDLEKPDSWRLRATNLDELEGYISLLKEDCAVNPKDTVVEQRRLMREQRVKEKELLRRADKDSKTRVVARKRGRGKQRKGQVSNSEESSESDSGDEDACAHCFRTKSPDMLLLCDACDAGYHTSCLSPPVMIIPDGDWFCPFCCQVKLGEALQAKYLQLRAKLRTMERKAKMLDYYGIRTENIVDSGSGDDANGRRSGRCKKRKVDYNFSDYDQLIQQAVDSDSRSIAPIMKSEEEGSAADAMDGATVGDVKDVLAYSSGRRRLRTSKKKFLSVKDEDGDSSGSDYAPSDSDDNQNDKNFVVDDDCAEKNERKGHGKCRRSSRLVRNKMVSQVRRNYVDDSDSGECNVSSDGEAGRYSLRRSFRSCTTQPRKYAGSDNSSESDEVELTPRKKKIESEGDDEDDDWDINNALSEEKPEESEAGSDDYDDIKSDDSLVSELPLGRRRTRPRLLKRGRFRSHKKAMRLVSETEESDADEDVPVEEGEGCETAGGETNQSDVRSVTDGTASESSETNTADDARKDLLQHQLLAIEEVAAVRPSSVIANVIQNRSHLEGSAGGSVEALKNDLIDKCAATVAIVDRIESSIKHEPAAKEDLPDLVRNVLNSSNSRADDIFRGLHPNRSSSYEGSVCSRSSVAESSPPLTIKPEPAALAPKCTSRSMIEATNSSLTSIAGFPEQTAFVSQAASHYPIIHYPNMAVSVASPALGSSPGRTSGLRHPRDFLLSRLAAVKQENMAMVTSPVEEAKVALSGCGDLASMKSNQSQAVSRATGSSWSDPTQLYGKPLDAVIETQASCDPRCSVVASMANFQTSAMPPMPMAHSQWAKVAPVPNVDISSLAAVWSSPSNTKTNRQNTDYGGGASRPENLFSTDALGESLPCGVPSKTEGCYVSEASSTARKQEPVAIVRGKYEVPSQSGYNGVSENSTGQAFSAEPLINSTRTKSVISTTGMPVPYLSTGSPLASTKAPFEICGLRSMSTSGSGTPFPVSSLADCHESPGPTRSYDFSVPSAFSQVPHAYQQAMYPSHRISPVCSVPSYSLNVKDLLYSGLPRYPRSPWRESGSEFGYPSQFSYDSHHAFEHATRYPYPANPTSSFLRDSRDYYRGDVYPQHGQGGNTAELWSAEDDVEDSVNYTRGYNVQYTRGKASAEKSATEAQRQKRPPKNQSRKEPREPSKTAKKRTQKPVKISDDASEVESLNLPLFDFPPGEPADASKSYAAFKDMVINPVVDADDEYHYQTQPLSRYSFGSRSLGASFSESNF